MKSNQRLFHIYYAQAQALAFVAFLHSHSPSYRNNEFFTKMEMIILDNFDGETHNIKIMYKTNKILINKLNKIIRDKRGDVIDNIIKVYE